MNDLKNDASAGSRGEPYPASGSNTAQTRSDAPRDYAKEYAARSSQQATPAQSQQSAQSRQPPGGGDGSDAADAIERTRSQATQLVADAKQKGQSMIDEKKTLAADEIAGMANVLRKTAENLNQEDQITTGRYAEQAAAGLDRLSTTLRDRDIATLLRQAESFARRSPGLFFGGAIAAGFFFSRFVKSTGERGESGDYDSSSRGIRSDFSHEGSPSRPHDSSHWEARDTGARTGYAEAAETGPGDRAGSGAASHNDALGDTAHNLPASGQPHADKRSGGSNAS